MSRNRRPGEANPFQRLTELQLTPAPAGAKPGQGKPTAPSATTASRPRKPSPAGPLGSEAATAGKEDEQALFRQAMGDLRPLSHNQAELARPKPRPVVRPKIKEKAAPTAAALSPAWLRQSLGEKDLFRQAMADATPLPESDRAEVGRAPRRPRRVADTAKADMPETLAPHLPYQETDPHRLFLQAVGTITPLANNNRAEVPRPRPIPKPRPRPKAEPREPAETAPTAPARRPGLSDHALASLQERDDGSFLRPGLASRTLADLRKGRWGVQGELDLHGYNRDEAREVLARFLASSLRQGRRGLRIIHGKGLGSPGGDGVLKHLSRAWLAQREEILAFCPAPERDGGDGALLVLLQSTSKTA